MGRYIGERATPLRKFRQTEREFVKAAVNFQAVGMTVDMIWVRKPALMTGEYQAEE